jgi:hypothetical protein
VSPKSTKNTIGPSSGRDSAIAVVAASAVRVGWSIHWLSGSAQFDASRPLTQTYPIDATINTDATTPAIRAAPSRPSSHLIATYAPSPVSANSATVAFMNR